MRRNRVLVVELNELSPPLMERFLRAHRLPHFARFRAESDVYVTEAAERAPFLEPWIQWITVHTGLTYTQHGIFNLGDAHKLAAPAIWDILSNAGLRVWICGSMSVHYDRPLRGAVLPDPWTTEVAPDPPELLPYFRFVQRQVTEHTQDHVRLSRRDYLEFLGFMVRHGLSASTAAAIAQQVLSERGRHNRWRRATLLDRLQLDVFAHYWRMLHPDFATFFSNSTAHYQHLYWRNLEPDRFEVRPSKKEQAEHGCAIEYGYRCADRVLGRLMSLAGDDTTLVFCTALSQQPCLLYEAQGGKTFFRPRDFAALLSWAGVTAPFSVAPVMTQYFHIRFADAHAAAAAAAPLRALTVGDEQALHVDIEGATLFCGCRLYRALPPSTQLSSRANGLSAPFFDLFYQLEGTKSGMHHPDGMLWIRTPERRHHVHEDKLPLERVTPMLLELFPLARSASPSAVA